MATVAAFSFPFSQEHHNQDDYHLKQKRKKAKDWGHTSLHMREYYTCPSPSFLTAKGLRGRLNNGGIKSAHRKARS